MNVTAPAATASSAAMPSANQVPVLVGCFDSSASASADGVADGAAVAGAVGLGEALGAGVTAVVVSEAGTSSVRMVGLPPTKT